MTVRNALWIYWGIPAVIIGVLISNISGLPMNAAMPIAGTLVFVFYLYLGMAPSANRDKERRDSPENEDYSTNSNDRQRRKLRPQQDGNTRTPQRKKPPIVAVDASPPTQGSDHPTNSLWVETVATPQGCATAMAAETNDRSDTTSPPEVAATTSIVTSELSQSLPDDTISTHSTTAPKSPTAEPPPSIRDSTESEQRLRSNGELLPVVVIEDNPPPSNEQLPASFTPPTKIPDEPPSVKRHELPVIAIEDSPNSSPTLAHSVGPWRTLTILGCFLVVCIVLFVLIVASQPRGERQPSKSTSPAADTQPSDQTSASISSVLTPDSNSEASTPPVERKDSVTNSIGMTFKRIKAGSFLMGSDGDQANEKPAHRVRITRDFYLGVCEVKQSEFRLITGSNPSHFLGHDLPVEFVSWEEANAFCESLTERESAKGRLKTGWRYRLPTEAEWEFAARAGSTSKWSHGNSEADLSEFAWFGKNSNEKTHIVGTKKPNAWGLYDMSGNVWEWCFDWYDENFYQQFTEQSASDPENRKRASDHVFRGGSYRMIAAGCRTANRGYWNEFETNRIRNRNRLRLVGFRVALSF